MLNIGRFAALSGNALVWDDYAVDILAFPDGAVEVIDEEEIPEAVDTATRSLIAGAAATVLAELDVIVVAIEDETPSLLARQQRVVER